MTQSWVKPFYRKQFEWMNNDIDMSAELEIQVTEIIEQIGIEVHTMLDIGAGMGEVARVLASKGIRMTTLELVPELVEYAKNQSVSSVSSLCGDFYTINLPEIFDVVSYFDGFGVGTDEEQLYLLTRISNWMKDDGCALIDIYQPSYWQKVSGQEMRIDQALRKYGYDEENQRMLDSWWNPDHPEDVVTQSLRCYTPEEISELCQQANLQIVGLFPGGAMDFDEWVYYDKALLHQCLSYRIKVKKKKDMNKA